MTHLRVHAYVGDVDVTAFGDSERLAGAVDVPSSLVKSRQRVVDEGEVFTPARLVEDMLDLVNNRRSMARSLLARQRPTRATARCRCHNSSYPNSNGT